MAEIWAAAVAVGGLALSTYGQSAQRVANNKAQDAAVTANATNANQNWRNYLATRGVAPNGDVATGEIPKAGSYTATNAKLPLWASITVPKNQASMASPAGDAARRTPFLTKRGVAPAPAPAAAAPAPRAPANNPYGAPVNLQATM